VNGRFLWYGASYGLCAEQPSGCHNVSLGACGFQLTHRVLVYESRDLSSGSWRLVGDALPVDGGRPSGIYFRPKVVYNPRTQLYVLWINYLRGGLFSQSQYLVAVSATPLGPFKVVADNVQTRFKTGGDFDILVDDNGGDGYLIYTSLAESHGISVERLADDFLSSRGAKEPALSSGVFGDRNCEAPALFRRNATYFALFGSCCCFCESGSNIGVYVAAHPLGPWTKQGEIGRNPDGSSSTKAQQNAVFRVPTSDGDSGDLLMWTGDRWQSSPDKLKDHDGQFWSVIRFNDQAGLIPVVQPIPWVDSFFIDVA
jgi:hypothetical protein